MGSVRSRLERSSPTVASVLAILVGFVFMFVADVLFLYSFFSTKVRKISENTKKTGKMSAD
jgi:hypothetical protein